MFIENVLRSAEAVWSYGAPLDIADLEDRTKISSFLEKVTMKKSVKILSPGITNSTKLSPSENPLVAQLLKNFPNFKEPEGSLPYSQEPSSGPSPKPDQSSPYHPILDL
jgi:hypothetical protein